MPLADCPNSAIESLGASFNRWEIVPAGTEGYRTAEVTLGGVDTNALSSKTMEAKNQPGLYFIGEVVDVTGHLGGFNFQWAWSSGFAAGGGSLVVERAIFDQITVSPSTIFRSRRRGQLA